jgi:hypothetical protein
MIGCKNGNERVQRRVLAISFHPSGLNFTLSPKPSGLAEILLAPSDFEANESNSHSAGTN